MTYPTALFLSVLVVSVSVLVGYVCKLIFKETKQKEK